MFSVPLVHLQGLLSSKKNTPELHIMERNTPNIVEFEIPTAVAMKGSIFWDIMPCGPLKVT
jgi:hypothetical protein